jgi:prepilin-type processing-associated H-X9-DG protein
LIELLVVIAIIALLLSLLTPSLQQAKALGVRAQCFGMEHAQMLALSEYVADFDGQFPRLAVWYCYSPSYPGPSGAWFTRSQYDDYREGIGDYLSQEGGGLQCSAAVAYNESLNIWPAWRVDRDLPTYVPNRTVVPYNPWSSLGSPPWNRCAKRVDRVGNMQRTFVFADGDWRGVFQAFDLSTSDTTEQPRFYWRPHMDGTDVAYLDGHAAWVSADQNVHPGDWPSYNNPCLSWCDMTDWAIMWE